LPRELERAELEGFDYAGRGYPPRFPGDAG
jgi:hypothetical protein